MLQQVATQAHLGVTFALVCKDKDGNVLKVIDVQGAMPLDTPTTTEGHHGLDDQRGGK